MLKSNLYINSYLNIINEDIKVMKYKQIASAIGGEYIAETNIIDCKGNKVRFYGESFLFTGGTFDFKLINASDDWSYMFEQCHSLTHLPEDFTIPEGVVNCNRMFGECVNLTHLPENFIIPKSVIRCIDMFFHCSSLTHLPKSFTIPNTVKSCSWMFEGCKSLVDLPEDFKIPLNSIHDGIFNNCDKLENKDPEAYMMWEI